MASHTVPPSDPQLSTAPLPPAAKPQPFALEKIDMILVRPPHIVLSEAQRASKAITKVLESNPDKLILNNKRYLKYEDWQTVGRFFGVTAAVKSTRYVEYGEGDYAVRGFEAIADALLVGPDQVISSAEALCLNDELNWSRKPLFQLKSMAQTRACAKALRNVLAWVVVLAGYAPTPAEEMDQQPQPEGNGFGIQQPRRKQNLSVGHSVDPRNEDLNSVFPPERRA